MLDLPEGSPPLPRGQVRPLLESLLASGHLLARGWNAGEKRRLKGATVAERLILGLSCEEALESVDDVASVRTSTTFESL